MRSRMLPLAAVPPTEDVTAPAPPKGIVEAGLPPEPAPTKHAESTYLPKRKRRGVALCLSGGGYRAALFHLGAAQSRRTLALVGQVVNQ